MKKMGISLFFIIHGLIWSLSSLEIIYLSQVVLPSSYKTFIFLIL